jgi:NAD(P)-dependent dehydrogenase (short-subunit alcohol dehydrogenase family)
VTVRGRFDLSDKVALVTGGSRGLGREMVLGLAEAGADVIVVSRKLDACQRVAEEVRRTTGRRSESYSCHVGNWDAIGTLVDQVYATVGRVDILVNNAGMSPLYGRPTDISEALFDKVTAVNLKGAFRLSALVGERMLGGEGGSIINISSIAAVQPRSDTIVYAAAKAGLNAMTIAFARAYGPTVRVNCIMCGPFLTDVSKAWDMPAFEVEVKTRLALKRGGRPSEVVGAALYLASEASSFTTGAILRVDGGAA